jgi:hypothetical protein
MADEGISYKANIKKVYSYNKKKRLINNVKEENNIIKLLILLSLRPLKI